VGASAGPDAGRWAGDRGHRAQFQELARGFPWAWDEEVAAGAAQLLKRQDARLAAACRVAADAFAEAVLRRRGVLRAVGPERELSGAWDAKVAVAQDAACRERRELQAQRGVRSEEPLAQLSPPETAQQVSLPELQARELVQTKAPLLERASRLLVPEQVVPRWDAQRVPGPLASPPPADVPAQREAQQERQVLTPQVAASARRLWLPLLSPSARLPRRFPRPLHLADGA